MNAAPSAAEPGGIRPVADLDLPRLMATLAEAQEAACIAHAYARPPVDGDAALKHIAAAQEAVETAMRRLKAAGVDVPKERPRQARSTASSDAFSLSALSSLAALDTSAARRLLDALRGILPTAERLDYERGNWYENAPPSDTKGTDFGEAVYHLICRLELELSGPKGRAGE